MSLLARRMRWSGLARTERTVSLRVALLASFTVEPLVPYLGTGLEDAGLPASIRVGPYNQIVQECLGDGLVADHAPDVLLVWPRLEDLWQGMSWPSDDVRQDGDRHVADLLEVADAASSAAARWRATLVAVLPALPEERVAGVGDAALPGGVHATAVVAREAMRRRLAQRPEVVLVDAEDVLRRIGTEAGLDRRLQALADVPYTELLFQRMGDQIARAVRAHRAAQRAVVVVGDDGVLWRGTLGTQGPSGVVVGDRGPGQPHRALQGFLASLVAAGGRVALSSSNDEATVMEALRRPDMLLRREHLAAVAFGGSVATRARSLERDLGVLPSSLILVQAANQPRPEGLVSVELPADPSGWYSALDERGVFDATVPHAAAALLRVDEQSGREVPDYLAELQVSAEATTAQPNDAPLLAGLLARARHFTLRPSAPTEQEARSLCEDPRRVVRILRAREASRDLGAVGAYVLRLEQGAALLEHLALYRRALGRGLERALVADAFEEAARRGVDDVRASIDDVPANEPARAFLRDLGVTTDGAYHEVRRLTWPAPISRPVVGAPRP